MLGCWLTTVKLPAGADEVRYDVEREWVTWIRDVDPQLIPTQRVLPR